jgi:antirestriction protein ArdC
MKTDLYEEITSRIIAQLEAGVVPWSPRCLSSGGLPRNHATGREYRGINVFLLACLGFTSPDFMTFIQAREMGGHVRKGEKGFMVVKYGTYKTEESAASGESAGADGEGETRRYLKAYTVFHVSQIEGIDFPPSVVPPELPLTERTARAREIVAGMPNPPEIQTGGRVPCYIPALDCVRMPERGFFRDEESFFATTFHELAHSTGALNRLARKSLLENRGFHADSADDRKIYAEEELVAEMGSAFLCAHAGICRDGLPNSAAYLQGWIDALKSKDAKGWIIRAASQAQKAADHILNIPVPV